VGLAVTAGNGAANSVDGTNFNQAVFDHLQLNSPVCISTVPNQITTEATPTPAIPFTVSSADGSPLTVTARSSDTNLLSAPDMILGGTGPARTITLAPGAGLTGTSTVTLTASDGTNSASTEFVLTVLAATGASLSRVLLHESFSNYPAANLPGRACLGTGFAAGATWLGLNSSFAGAVGDAATVSFPGLDSPLTPSGSGKVTVK
jgi:hypothetical protein